MNYKYTSLLLFYMIVSITLTACNSTPPPKDKTFRSCLGFDDDSDWVVLSRPNTLWKAGTVVEVSRGKEPTHKGNFLRCFSGTKHNEGQSPPISCSSKIDYGLSLSATIGLTDMEFMKVGLSVGGDSSKPNYSSQVKLDSAIERTIDMTILEEDILKNYGNMSRGCQLSLADASRFIIDQVYQIDKGSIEVVRMNGVKVDLNAPNYKLVKDAAINAGFSVAEDGSIKIPDEMEPVTFAVHVADFSKVLKDLGIERRGVSDEFARAMEESGASVRY